MNTTTIPQEPARALTLAELRAFSDADNTAENGRPLSDTEFDRLVAKLVRLGCDLRADVLYPFPQPRYAVEDCTQTAPGHCTSTSCRYRLDDGLCTLTVAALGPQTLEAVGRVLDESKQRVEQLEKAALKKLQRRVRRLEIA